MAKLKEETEEKLLTELDFKAGKVLDDSWKVILSGIYNLLSSYDQKVGEVTQAFEEAISFYKDEVIPLLEHLRYIERDDVSEQEKKDYLQKSIVSCEKLFRFSDSQLNLFTQQVNLKAGVNLAYYLKSWSQLINKLKEEIGQDNKKMLATIHQLETQYAELVIQTRLKEYKTALKTILLSMVEIEGIAVAEIISDEGEFIESAKKIGKDYLINDNLRQLMSKGFNLVAFFDKSPFYSWVVEFSSRLVVVMPLNQNKCLLLVGDDGSSMSTLKITLENTNKMKNVLEKLLAEREELRGKSRTIKTDYTAVITAEAKQKEYRIALKTILSSIVEIEGVSIVELVTRKGKVVSNASKRGKDYILNEFARNSLIEGFKRFKGVLPKSVITSWILEFQERLIVAIPLRKNIILILVGDDNSSFSNLKITIENTQKMKKIIEDIL